jgi:prolyl-tRNA editing enzyme YbaK/EbsC (Cys-tRNA(Pro) deacylase)
MSIQAVQDFLATHAPDVRIIPLNESSSTYTLSAEWGIAPAQIAKTLTLRIGERNVLVVACGDSRLDNKKVKATLGGKATMLPADQATALTGHPAGGVCPFALKTPLPVYFDVGLKAYDEVVPAAGDTHAAIRIDPFRMADLVAAEWVDVCRDSVPS